MGGGGQRPSSLPASPSSPPSSPSSLGAPLLLRWSEVPPSVTESFILSGYRCPGYSLTQCLASAFRPTNETGNFWTHFLAVFVFAFRFGELFWGAEGPGAKGASDPFYYPLWSYFLGVCGLLLASSLAHLLNSMSLVIREVCFYIDYGTISAYTVGSSLAYFYYIYPRGGETAISANLSLALRSDVGGHALGSRPWLEALYVPSACLIALFCTLACCCTRRLWPRHRYLIRTLVFLLPFLVVSLPVFHKLWHSGAAMGPTGHFFLRHCAWLLASGVFNVSKLPERLSPGRFDIWGHSHQWFHCCTFMSILDELHMIRGEIREVGRGHGGVGTPTFLSTFGVMLLLLALLAALVTWFGVRESHRQNGATRKEA
nr:membrane progesterone receptor epsilon-like [Anolis sagrei ordinatus]XP_060635781.1 membrane progesterone receptor epsilon-like [Anolis sagrei ordinatus]XP_060635782.1 membrane progesterone receptor epsilon-like [Anolis sagrei ordinatus]